jgi:DNA polymerase delta subunit 1
VLAQIMRYSTQEGFVIPSKKDALGDQTFEGATVIDPKKGFYRKPIATLDFASL